MKKRETPPWRIALPVPGPGLVNARINARYGDGSEEVLTFQTMPKSVFRRVCDVAGQIVESLSHVDEHAYVVHVLNAGVFLCATKEAPAGGSQGWVSIASPAGASCAFCLAILSLRKMSEEALSNRVQR